MALEYLFKHFGFIRSLVTPELKIEEKHWNHLSRTSGYVQTCHFCSILAFTFHCSYGFYSLQNKHARGKRHGMDIQPRWVTLSRYQTNVLIFFLKWKSCCIKNMVEQLVNILIIPPSHWSFKGLILVLVETSRNRVRTTSSHFHYIFSGHRNMLLLVKTSTNIIRITGHHSNYIPYAMKF